MTIWNNINTHLYSNFHHLQDKLFPILKKALKHSCSCSLCTWCKQQCYHIRNWASLRFLSQKLRGAAQGRDDDKWAFCKKNGLRMSSDRHALQTKKESSLWRETEGADPLDHSSEKWAKRKWDRLATCCKHRPSPHTFHSLPNYRETKYTSIQEAFMSFSLRKKILSILFLSYILLTQISQSMTNFSICPLQSHISNSKITTLKQKWGMATRRVSSLLNSPILSYLPWEAYFPNKCFQQSFIFFYLVLTHVHIHSSSVQC